MLKRSRLHACHEDIVAEQYTMLRRAALHLAGGDDAEAGDLLHDTFVRFLLLRPDLERIDYLDGYLYTMLRNVYLSRQRRHGRRTALVTDAVDVELLAAMVDEPGPSERLRMRDDLTRLVAHARERTRVSRGASAWVLRCLHGYYPTEIAHLTKMPPRSIDRALSVARREAHEELRKPSRRLRARVRGRRDLEKRDRWRDLLNADASVADPLDTLQVLRARLFASVEGPCLTDQQIADLYRPDSDDPIGTLVLAHVVACADCLDRINHHLGLSPLNMRDPVEANATRRRRGGGPDGESGSGGDSGSGMDPGSAGRAGTGAARAGGSARGGDGGLDSLLRRTRDTLQSIGHHVPRELRIAANGFDLGAQPVTGAVTVQELAIRLAESLAFIEIFDERGALVCYWPARVPNEGALDEHATIDMAEGRRFELQLSLTDDCPRLRVRYTDERVLAARHDSVLSGVGGTRHAAARTPFVDAAEHGPWWRWIVPSRRMATAVGMALVLWMILIGPTTTWAALAHLGRAAAAAIRSLMGPEPPATPPASAPAIAPRSPSAAAAPVTPPRAASPAPTFSPAELADLEMAARVTLRALNADLGEDLTLAATPAGVAVRGVVANAARRDAIARAFADRDGVHVDVRTVHDVAARARSRPARAPAREPRRNEPAPSAVRLESPDPSRPLLEDTLAAHLPDPAARAAFVNDALARADEALARAWALRRLAERYPPREVASLSPRSSQALDGLLDDHATALRAVVDALVTRITPLLVSAGAVDGVPHDTRAGGAAATPASAPPRLSIMQMFSLVNVAHGDAHALLAGAGTTSVAASAGRSDPLHPTAAMLLSRLRQIHDAVSRPDSMRH